MHSFRLYSMILGTGLIVGYAFAQESLSANVPAIAALSPGGVAQFQTPALSSNTTYAINLGMVTGGLTQGEDVMVRIELPGSNPIEKRLHAGDPSMYLPLRSQLDASAVTVSATRSAAGPERPIVLQTQWVQLAIPEEAARFEAEPNDTPDLANPLHIGVTVEGSVDDVEYLDNQQEGKNGLDWFRIEIDEACLVLFEMVIPDRDVSVNMRAYTKNESGEVVPYEKGKDPMEIVHDREKERYSKSISRVFEPGVYYLEVNANHPRYLIRTHKYPVPPYTDPTLAVEVGLRYVMDVGDAWFAQIPREGNIYQRAANMHETAMRCTACHPSVFSTEPNLVAHRNGYPIPSKQNFRYVIERIYNSMAPFYGPGDMYWQRFIAIPLQSQGKQGGLLIDFEKQISGRETPIVDRFGPMLRTAWIDRDVLPEDEANGVVPADSAFGFAWRDWRVLQEVYRRTGDTSYLAAADNIEKIFTAKETETLIDNVQDRVHFALGLSYMGREYYRERIQQEVDALFAMQNEDGSWHEEGKTGSAGAVYTTGQLLYSFMEMGLRPESDPRIERGLQWLLAQQHDFGGWYQTTTHENFRTPMRETRYALMALSSGYPKGAPLRGLGNLNDGPAELPAPEATPAQIVDRFENIQEVPGARQAEVAAAAIPYLARPEAPVRAAAAALLGRIGREESVEPLHALLTDPSKPAWREAAWALRQLGNRGYGVEKLKTALMSPDVLVRRGASRVFAYQFQEMDGRLDIARAFIPLTGDPDLLTRLQAIRTLRQWWYRSDDTALRTEIVSTLIDRMGMPNEFPIVRTNLAQNMYILLDENQTGGVSIQRNIRDFPKETQDAVLAGRAWVEENLLLKPVLNAIATGNDLQREALLESFDGSFFKGRFYARVPRNMIDVGNDREFSFLYQPDADLLARSIGNTVKTETRAKQRQRGIQLASFFEMPQHTADTALQLTLLDNMTAEEPELREAAYTAVSRDWVVSNPNDETIAARLLAAIEGSESATRKAVLLALSRSPEALKHAPIRDAISALTDRVIADEEHTADLLPFVQTDLLDELQALDMIDLAWSALEGASASDRIPVVEVLAKRSWQNEEGEDDGLAMPRKAVRVLQKAATDPEVAVREKVFELLPAMESLRKSKRATPVLFAGLSDESPTIRLKALQLARENDALWENKDVHEYVLPLLIDADAKTRKSALEAVAERSLVAAEPRYAARVKAVVDGDAELKDAAAALLNAAALDPQSVQADAQIAAVYQPDILFFRDHVNRYLYEPSADKNSCANCHATHTILGLAEAPKEGQTLTDSQIIANYRSMLKVVNVSDPEQSLILRKPRSPFGTGNVAADSPTGITHVGGIRWEEGAASEAYQAVLAFVRTAQQRRDPVKMTATVDSYSPEYPPAYAVDGNPATIWHTEFVGASPGYPHELVVALESPQGVAAVTYHPRTDGDSGRVKAFEIFVSADGENWGEPVATGEWANDATPKTAFVPPAEVRYVKLRGLSEVKGQPYMSVAELELHFAKSLPRQVSGL
ncbi:MAG: hypothetical protein AMXMBFR84_20280 [Candidatus Hydrogenedentota bacterium]